MKIERITYGEGMDRKIIYLRIESETGTFLAGTRLKRSGDDFSYMKNGVIHTETFVLDKSIVSKRHGMIMSKKYGWLERVK